MSYRKQKKYLEILKRYERKMDQKELERYKMMIKRDKMEEDLDKLSLGFLEELHQKYHVNRVKPNYDHIFKSTD